MHTVYWVYLLAHVHQIRIMQYVTLSEWPTTIGIGTSKLKYKIIDYMKALLL